MSIVIYSLSIACLYFDASLKTASSSWFVSDTLSVFTTFSWDTIISLYYTMHFNAVITRISYGGSKREVQNYHWTPSRQNYRSEPSPPHPIRPLETFLVPSMHPNIPNIFTHSTHQWFGSHSIRVTCARLNGEERQSRQVAGLLFRIDTFSRGEVFEEGVGNPIQCIIGKNINSLKECFKLDKTC